MKITMIMMIMRKRMVAVTTHDDDGDDDNDDDNNDNNNDNNKSYDDYSILSFPPSQPRPGYQGVSHLAIAPRRVPPSCHRSKDQL